MTTSRSGACSGRPSRMNGPSLVANEYLSPFILIDLAVLFDVDSDDSRFRAEVVSPHSEATAAVNTNLKHMDISADELLKMTVVNVEVVSPLPDSRSFSV